MAGSVGDRVACAPRVVIAWSEMTVAELIRFQEAEEALGVRLAGYVGRWVAVRNHEVVADAATPAELLERVEGLEYEAMFEVPEYSEGGCFF